MFRFGIFGFVDGSIPPTGEDVYEYFDRVFGVQWFPFFDNLDTFVNTAYAAGVN